MEDNLQPLSPADGKQMYLDERRSELADATVQAHHYRLKQFVQWCDEQGIDNLNNLDGRDLHRYRVYRRDDCDLSTSALKGNLSTLRCLLRFCASIDGVPPSLDEKVLLPTTTRDDARDKMLDSDRAEAVLDYLRRFKYASRPHTIIKCLWHTGLRIGSTYSLDIRDYDANKMRFELHHRPDEGTPLKNGRQGERYVSLGSGMCTVLDDWIEHQRPDVTDDYGRQPLFSSREGRLSKTNFRGIVYRYTRPCIYSDDCPHGRDIDECEAADALQASKCPSSVSPHPIRRGSITNHLLNDVPEKAVSDRMDVGRDTLDRHYDRRTAEEKAEQRRKYLSNI